MYKTLGFKWLLEVFCPASAFATADRDEARNPQRFIHVTVSRHTKKCGGIKQCVHTIQAAGIFAAALFLTALASFPLQAGTHKESPRAQSAKSLDSSSFVHLLDSLAVPRLGKYHIPGMAITIVRDGKIILAKGYGYADLERKIPFDPENTVIRIASVSKLFTATAVLQLADKGTLDMQRNINTYLTRFKVEDFSGKPITLQHLLTHTAGFDDRTIGKSARTQESQIPLGDFLATNLPRRICPPGEVYTYSNFSNALAGFVVEEASQEDYAEYVRRNILEPLGMKQSDYRLRHDLQPLLAQCYMHNGSGFRRLPFDFINDYPGGQMLSTATDMAKFMIAHLQLGEYNGTRILSEKSALAMHSVQFTHHKELEHAVGYSFGILPVRSDTILMHDGGYTGVASRLCIDPARRFGFFIACNIMDGALTDEVSRAILDLIIPEAPPDSTHYPLIVLPPYDKNVAEFAGTYRYSRYVHNDITKAGVLIGMTGPEMKIEQTADGMILMARYFGAPRRMIQVEPCVFRSIDDKYTCAFRRDASGKITHLFTNGTTALEKISWYETATFQRGLLGVCLAFFAFVSIPLPIIQKFRKKKAPAGMSFDSVHWYAQKTSSTFLLYFLALGIVMELIIPQEEMMLGFAHGMHWTAYVAQTIGMLGILFLAGLISLLLRRFVAKSNPNEEKQTLAGIWDILTAIAGIAFVWFLWYWNLIGYRF